MPPMSDAKMVNNDPNMFWYMIAAVGLGIGLISKPKI